MKNNENISFEESLKKLEDAVNSLKSGDIGLEDSVKIYEDSVKYYEICKKILDDAKQKIEIYNPLEEKMEDFVDE